MDKFTFFKSYYEALKAMPKEDRADAIMAMCAYAFDEEEDATAPGTGAILIAVAKPFIDSSRAKSEAGKTGGRGKKAVECRSDSGAHKAESEVLKAPEKQTENSFKQYEYEYEKEKEYDYEKEKEDEKGSFSSPSVEEKRTGADAPAPSSVKRKRFLPPSADDVAAYCAEHGYGVDAEAFVDFYAAKGWKVGTSPMTDWKAAVRTWAKRDGQKRGDGNAGRSAASTKPKNGPYATSDADRARCEADAVAWMKDFCKGEMSG